MIIFLVAAMLAATTTVHELGHLMAARARRARVVRVAVGRGPKLAAFRWSGVEYVFAWLPLGGRLDYEPPQSGTANAVIAIGGAAANLAFGFVVFLTAASVIGVERMPYGVPGTNALAYAVASASTWLRVLPWAIVELMAHGDVGPAAGALAALRTLLVTHHVAGLLHAVAALSVLWAVLNMVPIPWIATDGWQFLVSLRDSMRTVRRSGAS